jgi:hypothetical protein
VLGFVEASGDVLSINKPPPYYMTCASYTQSSRLP